jgi:hypothetical protein
MSGFRVAFVVDRVEGDFAVLEVGGRTVDWPLAALPAGVTEGSRWSCVFTADAPSTALTAAEERIRRLDALGPPGDDIDL